MSHNRRTHGPLKRQQFRGQDVTGNGGPALLPQQQALWGGAVASRPPAASGGAVSERDTPSRPPQLAVPTPTPPTLKKGAQGRGRREVSALP